MIFIYIFFILILFIIIALFAFPQFSPIPYFPSNKKDLPLILKALHLHNNQVVFDLGAGDGLVIFEAAQEARKRNLNTMFVAVKINPILLLILHVRRLLHQNRKNIKIVYENMFSMDFSSFIPNFSLSTTCYLYISPWFLEKTINNIRRQMKHAVIVSYMYAISSLRKEESVVQGTNALYSYKVRSNR